MTKSKGDVVTKGIFGNKHITSANNIKCVLIITSEYVSIATHQSEQIPTYR